jgi:hypothetical protein
MIPAASYNYLFDPYGIFRNKSLKLGYELGYEPNQHYAKMRYLLNYEHSFDSYLFGSSRVGKINPDLISDGNYYNMNYSEGVPGEHLEDIKIMLKNGVPVKNVIIGLDNSSYTIRPETHRGQIMRHPYDDSLVKKLLFQVKYLISAPRFSIMKYFRQREDDLLINFNILGNGMQNLENVDMNIERNIERHVASDRFHAGEYIRTDGKYETEYVQRMEDMIRDIKKTVKLSKTHHFNLVFFINPIHKNYYVQNDPHLFHTFKKELAQITDYWDFSGFNSVTTDNYYYYEISHYRVMVGDFVACRMTHCENIRVPDDFGLLVTSENVDDHINNQEDRYIAYTES